MSCILYYRINRLTSLRRRKILFGVLSVIIAVAVIIIYYNFNPADSGWVFQCPSKLVAGYDCPACGAQRALHAGLHGDISAAWHFNPFLFIGLPYLLLVLWGSFAFLPGQRTACRIAHNRVLAYGYIASFFIWWVVRNL